MAISYDVNTFEVLNRSGRSIEQVRALRRAMGSNFHVRFATKAIDQIFKRTISGNDVFGKPFERYSDSYKRSLAYRIYGKSSHVNLKLTGEMLSSMGIGSIRNGRVKIIIIGDLNNAKAEGHTFGIERNVGRGVKIKVGKRTKTVFKKQKVKRPFLGLSTDEENRIFEDTLREEIAERPLLYSIEGGVRLSGAEGRFVEVE